MWSSIPKRTRYLHCVQKWTETDMVHTQERFMVATSREHRGLGHEKCLSLHFVFMVLKLMHKTQAWFNRICQMISLSLPLYSSLSFPERVTDALKWVDSEKGILTVMWLVKVLSLKEWGQRAFQKPGQGNSCGEGYSESCVLRPGETVRPMWPPGRNWEIKHHSAIDLADLIHLLPCSPFLLGSPLVEAARKQGHPLI